MSLGRPRCVCQDKVIPGDGTAPLLGTGAGCEGTPDGVRARERERERERVRAPDLGDARAPGGRTATVSKRAVGVGGEELLLLC